MCCRCFFPNLSQSISKSNIPDVLFNTGIATWYLNIIRAINHPNHMGFLARYDWPTGNSQQQQLKIMWRSQWRTKSWNKELKWRPGWLRKTVSYLSLCLQQFSVLIASDTAEVMNSAPFFFDKVDYILLCFLLCATGMKSLECKKGLDGMISVMWCSVWLSLSGYILFCSTYMVACSRGSWLNTPFFHMNGTYTFIVYHYVE